MSLAEDGEVSPRTSGPERRMKVAVLGMPSYGELTASAARGFFRASANKLDLRLHQTESSLLAHNMNRLWCMALNLARKGECDFFGMQHADIEPEDFWLDKAVEELEARDLDVLGVVAPIKDIRGQTSIAVARADGNPWRVEFRLTMREVMRLPETFTSEDVGGPLLLNTGLWVCKFKEEWARKVHFEINDRIVYNEKAGQYYPEVEPEDWYFSRLLHEQGLRIGCTRKIVLTHRGPMAFRNDTTWGTYSWDEEYQDASRIPGGEDFPHDCIGWLSEAEGIELARLAANRVVLEIGSYCGRSTVCMARTAKTVTAIDTFDGQGTPVAGSVLETFRANLRRYGVLDKVEVVQGNSQEVLPLLPPVYDLAFIDGSHDEESVRQDQKWARRCLRPGGLLAFHDYNDPKNPGVTLVVDDLLDHGGKMVSRCESLAVLEPPGD